jgi:hypothetical protein
VARQVQAYRVRKGGLFLIPSIVGMSRPKFGFVAGFRANGDENANSIIAPVFAFNAACECTALACTHCDCSNSYNRRLVHGRLRLVAPES